MARGSVSNRGARGRGWEARWYTTDGNGKRKQHSRSFDSKAKAERHLNRMLGDIDGGDSIDPSKGKVPFSAVAEDWYTTVQPSLKEKTAAGYRSILNHHLLPEFGPRAVAGINAGDIRRFIASIGAKPGTQRNILRVLSPVMDVAVLDGMIRTNPVKTLRTTVRLPRSQPNGDLPFLDEVQVAQLADEVGPTYNSLVYTAAYTGLRAGELAALRVRHLDPLHATLLVEESVSDVNGYLKIGKPKNGRSRTVTLPAHVVHLLEDQTNEKSSGEFIFGGATPLRHGNFYGRHFRPAVRRLVESGQWPEKLAHLRFHDLRHTAAALLIKLGVHPKAVADRLGHSSITITMDRYGKLYPGQGAEIADQLNRLFEDAQTQASTRLASVTRLP